MKTFRTTAATTKFALVVGVLFIVSTALQAKPAPTGAKMPVAKKATFTATGMMVDVCNCSSPCACELTGPNMSCEGLGVISFTGGAFKGQPVAGAKVAYALSAGEWFHLYVDAKNPKVAKAAADLAAAEFAGFGKMEPTTNATVAITGTGGKYTVSVNGGKIMKFTTEPVMGGDKKSPVMYSNTHSKLSPSFLQGKVTSGTYADGGHTISLSGTNAYFNDKLKSSGAY